MKKIGLCACYNTKNFGSMLQTLATEKELEELGFDYEIIRYSRKLTPALIIRSLSRIPEMIKHKQDRFKQDKRLNHFPEVKKGIKTRNAYFDQFMNETFVHFSPVYDTFGQLVKAAKNYDAVLVGSDQLWRPEGYTTGFYTLEFVPDEVKKIAYATSFGVSQIPVRKRSTAKKFLNRIEHISVRELRASEMVKELTGRTVTTVVDPTLLFDAEQWDKIIPVAPVEEVGEHYIFCYLLGTNTEHRKAVEMLAKKTGCSIVTIPHLDEFVENDLHFGDKQLYNVGPAEFVNLIRYAEYVCTDSFHGSVFSILNHKQFVTFSRFADESKNSRNSRIESLLSQTGLKARHCKEYSRLIEQIGQEISYEQVEKKLAKMREQSVKYLKTALGMVEL